MKEIQLRVGIYIWYLTLNPTSPSLRAFFSFWQTMANNWLATQPPIPHDLIPWVGSPNMGNPGSATCANCTSFLWSSEFGMSMMSHDPMLSHVSGSACTGELLSGVFSRGLELRTIERFSERFRFAVLFLVPVDPREVGLTVPDPSLFPPRAVGLTLPQSSSFPPRGVGLTLPGPLLFLPRPEGLTLHRPFSFLPWEAGLTLPRPFSFLPWEAGLTLPRPFSCPPWEVGLTLPGWSSPSSREVGLEGLHLSAHDASCGPVSIGWTRVLVRPSAAMSCK